MNVPMIAAGAAVLAVVGVVAMNKRLAPTKVTPNAVSEVMRKELVKTLGWMRAVRAKATEQRDALTAVYLLSRLAGTLDALRSIFPDAVLNQSGGMPTGTDVAQFNAALLADLSKFYQPVAHTMAVAMAPALPMVNYNNDHDNDNNDSSNGYGGGGDGGDYGVDNEVEPTAAAVDLFGGQQNGADDSSAVYRDSNAPVPSDL